MVARITVVAHVPIVSVIAVVDGPMRRVGAKKQSIIVQYLAQVAAVHVDEDALLLEVMPDVRPVRRVKLSVHEVGDVLSAAVE